MEKITRKMSKGTLGIGIGIASLVLSGCILTNNYKLNNEVETLEEYIVKTENKLEDLKLDNDSYKTKIIELKKSLDSYVVLNNDLNKNLEQFKVENERLKAELEKNKIDYYETTMEVTAYTAGYESTQKKKGDVGYGITASGTFVKEGRTIACPKSFGFGTVIEIEGYGKRTCEDRGGAIKNGKLDLYMDSLSEAQKFGRKKLKVKVYKG